jgi:hypothetical protein
MIVEGYAALFGVADLERDVVHRGAFARSILEHPTTPMLLRHETRLRAGTWHQLREDARGLFVRGRIESDAPAGALALREIAEGVDGLSIGFRTLVQRKRADGRDLYDLDLIEISIVPRPMAPRARLFRAPQLENTHAKRNQDGRTRGA